MATTPEKLKVVSISEGVEYNTITLQAAEEDSKLASVTVVQKAGEIPFEMDEILTVEIKQSK